MLVLGNLADRRIALLQAAHARLGLEPAQVIDYTTLLDAVAPGPPIGVWHSDRLAGMADGPGPLSAFFASASTGHSAAPSQKAWFPADSARHWLRIESPGKDEVLRQRIAALGSAGEPLAPAEIAGGAAWYRGFTRLLRHCAQQRGAWVNHPAEIAVMFNKPACQARLAAAGVRVPQSLGSCGSFAELVERMQSMRISRVFVKIAYGSSASGVVAYQRSGGRQRLIGPVELVREAERIRLFNSRRIATFTDEASISAIIDTLCREAAQIEAWLPKLVVQGRFCDLRVVVIGGEVRHCVARLSRGPQTNLHLLNGRADSSAIRARISTGAWQAIEATCEQTMRLFPASLYAGIDVLIEPDGRHAVLEVNAFGDLLPGSLDRGDDTYTAELRCLMAQNNALR